MRFYSTTTTDNPVSTDSLSTDKHVTQSHTPKHLDLLEDDDNWEHSGPAMPLTAAAPSIRYPSSDRKPPSCYDSCICHKARQNVF